MSNTLNTGSITVFDVARVAGVSKSTVSLVLNNSEKVSDNSRQKVEQAIIETGYVYNRDAASLRSRKSNLIAIVINDLTNPYAAELAVGLELQIRQMGLFSMIVNSGEDVDIQQKLVNNLKEYNVAAFIICPAPGTTAEWTNNIVKQGFPVVNIMREIAGANVSTVLPNNSYGTTLATAHLLHRGNTNLAFLGGIDSISDYHQRLAGFVNAMNAANVSVQAQLCIQSSTTREGGRQAMKEALTVEPNIKAVVCFNDVIAYGAIEHIRSLGKEPGRDIAIVGFDDLKDSCLMSPALSTIHVDANKIAIEVCKLLKDIKHSNSTTTLVDVKLIVRDSS